MKKSIIAALATAMFGATTTAQAKNVKIEEPYKDATAMDSNFFLRNNSGPIYHPTRSQKIKNKVNRLRRGIKK